MSHAKNKLDWCINKAKKELNESGKHRGIIIVTPDRARALKHIIKAEHDLEGAVRFHEIGFSDWSASALFYSMYQSFLAIALKFGYESSNQECTFALIHFLIEEKKIDLEKEIIDKVSMLELSKDNENLTSVDIREKYQYGTKLSIEENIYEELLINAKIILSRAKTIVEQ